jgi:hypothetical protein
LADGRSKGIHRDSSNPFQTRRVPIRWNWLLPLFQASD